jgi:hypothetical protein
MTKGITYSSQPYLLTTLVKQKIGIYNTCESATNPKTIDSELNYLVPGFVSTKTGKRPNSRSKKRRRPKSYKKKRTMNFLDNYVTEQYNEYK